MLAHKVQETAKGYRPLFPPDLSRQGLTTLCLMLAVTISCLAGCGSPKAISLECERKSPPVFAWSRTGAGLPMGAKAEQVVIDRKGEIVVAGSRSYFPNSKESGVLILRKYDALGEVMWTRTLTVSGHVMAAVKELRIDERNRICFSGKFLREILPNFTGIIFPPHATKIVVCPIFMEFNQHGRLLWSSTVSAVSPLKVTEKAVSFSIDRVERKTYIRKYSGDILVWEDSVVEWGEHWGKHGFIRYLPYGEGGVLVSGVAFDGEDENSMYGARYQAFLRRYSDAGNLLWERRFPKVRKKGESSGKLSLCVGRDGFIYVKVNIRHIVGDAMTGREALFAVLSPDGDMVNSWVPSGDLADYLAEGSMLLTNHGNFLVCRSPVRMSTPFILVDRQWQVLWSAKAVIHEGGYAGYEQFAIGPSGAIAVIGRQDGKERKRWKGTGWYVCKYEHKCD